MKAIPYSAIRRANVNLETCLNHKWNTLNYRDLGKVVRGVSNRAVGREVKTEHEGTASDH